MKYKIDLKKLGIKTAVIVFGALAGFLYYHFVGCVSGTCPITSNPYYSILYGALIGTVLTQLDFKKDYKSNKEREEL